MSEPARLFQPCLKMQRTACQQIANKYYFADCKEHTGPRHSLLQAKRGEYHTHRPKNHTHTVGKVCRWTSSEVLDSFKACSASIDLGWGFFVLAANAYLFGKFKDKLPTIACYAVYSTMPSDRFIQAAMGLSDASTCSIDARTCCVCSAAAAASMAIR